MSQADVWTVQVEGQSSGSNTLGMGAGWVRSRSCKEPCLAGTDEGGGGSKPQITREFIGHCYGFSCIPSNHMLNSQPPVRVLGDRAFLEVIKVK